MTDNPFSGFLKIPSRPSTARPTDREQQLNHQALEQVVAVLQALLGDGDPRRGRAVEFFEDITLTATGTVIKHTLGRVPRGYLVTYIDSGYIVTGLRDRWTVDQVVLASSASTPVVDFFLF